jgi:iron complex outermembrane receptor protein
MYFFKTILAASSLLLAMPLAAQYKIGGTVMSEREQEPVAGATIRIANTLLATQSGSDGRFELRNLRTGSYPIVISLIGYESYSDTIVLTEDKKLSITLKESAPVLMDEIVVNATRVDDKSAMAYTTISKEELNKQNLGQDLPYLLNQQPSVVTTSDAGAGVGYTGIRIRGVDATRVNVTINGVPVNDAESQGTFWVDMPDIASSIESIQMQRGVGSSTNGAGAFGGSINIQTTRLSAKPYATFNSSAGSFMTTKNTLTAGTGLINDMFAFDGRISKIRSAGFIDRATSDLSSYYLSGAYYGKKQILKFITFSGTEETYQAWNGVPEARLKGDVEGMNTYIINNWLDAEDAANLLNSDSRTYNQFLYPDQVDRYKQDYYQLHYSNRITSAISANVALHYTRGKGYYEEYKKDAKFSSYGLDDIIIGNDTISNTNLIRRRWLDNHFYGATFSLNYESSKKLSASLGGAINKYTGYHYGEIIWAQHALNSFIYQRYYNDTANKTDFNIYLRGNYQITEKLNLFADLQYRTINYSFLGFDDSLNNAQGSVSLAFINPKIGLNYQISPTANVYASFSRGSKEPSRSDYTDSRPVNYPRPELLNDYEAGYKQRTKNISWALNLYFMDYKDQLVLTGGLNDVGAYNRINVAKSYRQGIEVELAFRILKSLSWTLNATYSKNKIEGFEERIDNYDTYVQEVNIYGTTDIAFSPEIIAGSTIRVTPFKGMEIDLISKYVGEQYLDNTSNSKRKLDAFFVNDVRLSYTVRTKFKTELSFHVLVNNILNEEYESNGYTFGYVSYGQHIVENFYYPQAGTNVLAGIGIKF